MPKGVKGVRDIRTLPPDEFHAHQVNAGKARGRQLHERATFRKALKWVLDEKAFDLGNEAVEMMREKYPELTNLDAMNVALVAKVIAEGDARAYTVARDTTGELPAQTVNVNSKDVNITITTLGDDDGEDDHD